MMPRPKQASITKRRARQNDELKLPPEVVKHENPASPTGMIPSWFQSHHESWLQKYRGDRGIVKNSPALLAPALQTWEYETW